MSKMDKATVIYGQDTAKVPVEKVNWDRLREAIEAAVGTDAPIINLAAAKTSVAEARKGKNAAKTYVKVGLVANDLVLRVKTPGTLSDTEVDTILVKGAKALIARKKEEGAGRVEQSKLEYEQNKLREVNEVAEEHLELRRRMVTETEQLLAEVEEAFRTVDDLAQKADVHFSALKEQKGLSERMHRAGVIEQMRGQSQELLVQRQRQYKAFTRSGSPLMDSRVDFKRTSELPLEAQADYKRASGTYFRQASENMEEVAAKMDLLSSLDGRLEELMEQAQALVGAGMSPTQALVRLEDIHTDAEGVVAGIDRRYVKLTQTLDRSNQVWTTIISGREEQKAQRQRSFGMKAAEVDKLVEQLKHQKEPLDRINRRIVAIPEDVKGNPAVAKAIEAVIQQVSAARLQIRAMPGLLKDWKTLREEAEAALGIGG